MMIGNPVLCMMKAPIRTIFLIISILQNIKNSEIHLIIQGNGTQRILGIGFGYTPSEVLVNGVEDNSCSKICNLQGDKNNITLRFNGEITSCRSMFSGAKNIIDLVFKME